MGARKRYIERYNREPTDEELAAFKERLKEKAAKKERKKAVEPEQPAAAAIGSSTPVVAAAAAPPSGGKQSGSKRKRTEAAPSSALFASPAVLGRTASKAFVSSMAALSKAVDKAATSSMPDEAFKAAWAAHNAGAQSLLDQFESSLPARLTEEQRDALLQPYRDRLALSLTSPDAVLERCHRKHAAAEKVKADARKSFKNVSQLPKELKKIYENVDTSAIVFRRFHIHNGNVKVVYFNKERSKEFSIRARRPPRKHNDNRFHAMLQYNANKANVQSDKDTDTED